MVRVEMAPAVRADEGLHVGAGVDAVCDPMEDLSGEVGEAVHVDWRKAKVIEM